jgi:trehalose/maltose hydrolase-like predicted phosphorylase
VTPSEDCSKYEVHITADIAQAWWQYLVMTGDIGFLVPGRGMEAVFSIANYWLARTAFNDSLISVMVNQIFSYCLLHHC